MLAAWCCFARLYLPRWVDWACLLRSPVAVSIMDKMIIRQNVIDAAGMEALAPGLVHLTDLRVLKLGGKLQEHA